ncbi:unnamed protein product [Rhizoctonia solani]|uniref:Uncharacterized protein n=1 Tax=Rhizoctonia solani TaxID=456999 RepID=A0A8H2X2P6_9AGAM|nr:unnamed protein product [Rhizoctonia solani]
MNIFLKFFSWIYSLILSVFGRRPAPVVVTSEKWDEISSREPTVPVLIFGRFGSPRAKFVDTACACVEIKPEPSLKTSDVSVKRTVVEERPFKLINAPGFDDPLKSNLEVYMDIAQYLQSGELKSGVKGIIYVHDARDALQSRSLMENLNVLVTVLLGQSALRLLTVLVVLHHSMDAERSNSIIAEMQASESVFHAAQKGGARIKTSRLSEAEVTNLLKECASNDIVQLQIQRDRPSNLQQAIEQGLGYSNTDSVKAALAHQENSTTQRFLPDLIACRKALEATQKALGDTRQLLGESQDKAERFQTGYRQLELQIAAEQKRSQELNRKLQETQAEYSSLRSQLQLQENIEQSEVVLGLKDLNRAIEDIGRAFSAHFADRYAGAVFDKDPFEVTTLDAKDLTSLQVAFSHIEGEPSFIKSSTGAGMMVEDFFDYGIRNLLCSFLWQRVFNVFHPRLNDSFDQLLVGIYHDIQRREPQPVSGKWRVNTFNGINASDNQNQDKNATIANHAKEFCEGIKTLAQAFFGPDQDVQLEPTHSGQVEKLMHMAWDWNEKLKGKVVVLGDFYQTCFDPRSLLDPHLMEEFEPRKGLKVEKILGTLGLGLISLQALGGEQAPETTIVCKATVATESLYP